MVETVHPFKRGHWYFLLKKANADFRAAWPRAGNGEVVNALTDGLRMLLRELEAGDCTSDLSSYEARVGVLLKERKLAADAATDTRDVWLPPA